MNTRRNHITAALLAIVLLAACLGFAIYGMAAYGGQMPHAPKTARPALSEMTMDSTHCVIDYSLKAGQRITAACSVPWPKIYPPSQPTSITLETGCPTVDGSIVRSYAGRTTVALTNRSASALDCTAFITIQRE